MDRLIIYHPNVVNFLTIYQVVSSIFVVILGFLNLCLVSPCYIFFVIIALLKYNNIRKLLIEAIVINSEDYSLMNQKLNYYKVISLVLECVLFILLINFRNYYLIHPYIFYTSIAVLFEKYLFYLLILLISLIPFGNSMFIVMEFDGFTTLNNFDENIDSRQLTSNQIPQLVDLKIVDADELQGNCSICLEDFSKVKQGVSVVKLPCNHIFHQDCLKPWLDINTTCPQCRKCLLRINYDI